MADAVNADLTPLPNNFGTQYYGYVCSECGAEATNSYMEPHGSRMLAARHCFYCDLAVEREERLSRDHDRMVVIGGRIYGPGNRTSGSFRGMAGRRFDIEFIAPSKHDGKRITTFDLWAGETLTEKQRERYPDTARFLDGAHQAQVGETTCWNPSDGKGEPYPLPRSLDLSGAS